MQAGGKENETKPQGAGEITAFVQNLLNQMDSRFKQMEEGIATKLNDMGDRIDSLEKFISDLIEQSGVDDQELEEDVVPDINAEGDDTQGKPRADT
ncbi:hypothetical protein BSKO_08290 [Bryopsis sp. KO-2023]|nr:hypothetical protein BSKO_08290 [Bryopsis sp. KO-2023]